MSTISTYLKARLQHLHSNPASGLTASVRGAALDVMMSVALASHDAALPALPQLVGDISIPPSRWTVSTDGRRVRVLKQSGDESWSADYIGTRAAEIIAMTRTVAAAVAPPTAVTLEADHAAELYPGAAADPAVAAEVMTGPRDPDAGVPAEVAGRRPGDILVGDLNRHYEALRENREQLVLDEAMGYLRIAMTETSTAQVHDAVRQFIRCISDYGRPGLLRQLSRVRLPSWCDEAPTPRQGLRIISHDHLAVAYLDESSDIELVDRLQLVSRSDWQRLAERERAF